MSESLITARVEEARLLLSEARTLDDVKDLADKAKALEAYVRRRAAATEAHADAWEIVQHASRRMGQLTRELPTAPPGRKAAQEIRSEPERISKTDALAELGISKTQAHRWEGLAALDEAEYAARIERGRAVITRQTDAGGGLSASSARSDYDGDEYSTPAVWLEAGRKALGGGFDLDPATNLRAQELVQAERFYTRADDGLAQPWTSRRLWCNPPYSRGLCVQFTARFIAAAESREMRAGLLLVNAATDTGWFQMLLERFPVCLVRGRIAFLLDGEPRKGNEYSQALFYAGPNMKRFKSAYADLGKVLTLV